ncbi:MULTISPECIES: SDR family NAD(P)-dependent oxidoreductase [unclassified Streptomyces]|uniref:SDR family NAD(P)-dependent oxidoreductase n=1 Tax=unclassified Streptomyces TaxID=2593676 RepID=UPI00331D3E0F
MESLAPRYTDLAAPDLPGAQAGATVVITDRQDIASAARAIGAECWHCDPATESDERIGRELGRYAARCATLVVAWGDGQSGGTPEYDAAIRFARAGLALLQAVRESGRRVHLVTLSRTGDALPALLDGMARTAALECPLVHTAVEWSDAVTPQRLRVWIAAGAGRPGAVLRAEDDRIGLLEHTPRPLDGTRAHEVFGEGDNVVVIGGAGGIGRHLCRYLSRRCGARVFVLGRGTPGPGVRAALKEAGVHSHLGAPADDPEALDSALRYLHDRFGPVKAVFNLAGVLDDCLLYHLTPDRLEKVLRPKVATGLNLEALTGPHRPGTVVHFSSLTSVTGNVGQAAYGAANAFLDRLSAHRPDWYSVNWGLWDTDGMRMPEEDGSGLRAMPPEQACDTLLRALASGTRRLAVYDGQLSPATGAQAPAPPASAAPSGTADASAAAAPRSGEPSAAGLLAGTTRWLRGLIVRHSGLRGLREDENLLERGLDSVGSIRISRDIENRLGIAGSSRLSRAVLFEYPTVAALSAYLAETFAPELDAFLAHEHSPQTEATEAPRPTAPPESAAPSRSAVSPEPGPAPAVRAAGAPARSAEPQREPVSAPPGPEDAPAADAYRPGDIAVIGMAGEFPGGADTEAFWQALLRGEDAVRVIPGDRWDWRENHSFAADEPGTSYGRHGGFLDHALDFDPVFFNIAPAEARFMDPQERRFLQSVYHALEDAGYFARPTGDMGVFVAAMFGHYQDLTAADRVIGSSFAAIANRVSYAFDLHGPSVALDTMCSGGLTALHLAVRSIRAGDCALAVAGGVNLMTHPGKYRLLSEGRFLSPTGHCQAFGVEADGYVPGEGTAAVVLKPLSDALRDGDRVHAVIRATAVNSGGRTAGFTVPSERAQSRAIASALDEAAIEPGAVTYVEAHGTGTRLGDPIEVRGLGRAYGGPEQGRAYLGSVKSNIGHLESAAAMAGLVKVVKQLAHRTLAPTLHCALENPDLHLEDSRFTLVKEALPWPKGSGPTRFAGLSSFGAGGANGHAILQEFVAPPDTAPAPAFPCYFIPLSGRDEAAVRRRADQLLAAVRDAPDTASYLYGLSYTLCCARQHFRVRRGYWATSVAQLAERLANADGTVPVAPPAEDAWAGAAAAYLAGERADFAALFPRRLLVDAPLYPFADERYVADALDHANRPPARTAPAAPDARPAGEEALLLAPAWRPHAVPAPAGVPPRCVLVLTDRGPQPPLPEPPEGLRLIRVTPGDTLVVETDRIELPEGDDTAARRALDHLTGDLGLDHLYWLDLRREGTAAAQLSFAKALQGCRIPSTVLGVTRESEAAEARAWAGFLHGLAEENPHVRTVQARRAGDGHALADGWAPLLDELRAARDPLTEVRWADGTRYTRELTELRLADGIRLRDGGTYLVTGGLGKVGRAVAELLAERYRATVVAVGRSAPDAAQRQWIAGVPGLHYEQADITSEAVTRELVTTVRECFGGLDGVVHCAGVVRDALVQNKSARDAEAVLAPKLRGTLNLDRSTAGLPLDFFCVFSSISSVMGNTGQSDYIAANRFLDEFAAERARRVAVGERSGLSLSVNWPLWLDAEDERRERYQALAAFLRGQFGMEPLSSRGGAQLFLDLLDGLPTTCHQVVPCVGDVRKMRQRLLPGAARPEPPARGAAPSAPGPDPRPGATLEELGARLLELVRAQTGLRAEDIAFDSRWGDLGYDSVMLQHLARSLGPEFGVETPPNALFKYSGIASLSAYLRDQGAAGEPDTPNTPNTPDTRGRGAADTPGQGAAGPPGAPDRDRTPAVPRPAPSPASSPPAPAERSGGRGRYAVVGMSGIMPAGANLADFWRLLVENGSAIRPVERWKNRERQYFAGTIDGHDAFDHSFFGLSAREAMLMDPQHRLFLQSAYNALLDAGYAPGALREVGVFAGVQFSEYQAALQHGEDRAHPYTVTGNAHAMLANRVSHLLDLTGPSQTVDTACSSGLVALNRGVLSLAAGECDVALVGAVSVLVDPAATDAASQLGVLSPDFRCATFDKDANGYVRAEGVGCVVVKRLDDARRDGDAVLAVIEAVAENHDGRSHSLTAPNPDAQVALLHRVYTPELAERVSHIEAHGTGTNLGDPVEIGALRTAFGRLAPHRAPGSITLGAVKTNVGHLEPAAGMAGLLKLLLCLRHRRLPANINFEELNPLVELAGSPFRLLLENEPWERDTPLVAGVSSFGFGGSNAHAILSEAPAPAPRRTSARPYWLVTLSARSRASLTAMRDDLLEWLDGPEAERADLGDIAHTLAVGRDHFEYRLAWIVADAAELRRRLARARPEEAAKCRPRRLTTHPVRLPDPADPGHRAALEDVRARYAQGEDFAWQSMFEDGRFARLHLPGYAFEKNRFWFE